MENFNRISALVYREIFSENSIGAMIMKNFLLAAVVSAFLFGSIVTAQSPLDGFDVNVNGQVNAIAVQTDGKIIIGGGFSQVAGISRNNLARLNPNGTVDTTFNPNPSGQIFAITLQPNGMILVGGGFITIAGGSRPGIARLDIDGTLDFFNAQVNDFVYAIAIDSTGKVLIGGRFTEVSGFPRRKIARLEPDFGTLDSFNPDADSDVRAISVQSNGKILVGGFFTNIGGASRKGLARLNPNDGSADSLNPFGIGSSKLYSIVIQPNGKFLVGGEFIGGFLRKKIARIDSLSETEDTTFSTEILGSSESGNTVYSIALQTNGKILIGGFFGVVNNQTRGPLTRLNADGSLDPTFFSSNPNSTVFSVVLQSSGKILIGGEFTSLSPGSSTITRNRLAALEHYGTPDTILDIGILNGAVNKIVPQPDGKIIIVGSFTLVRGVERNKIARLNPDGTLDTLFNPNLIGSQRITAVALDSLGRVLVGGEFTNIGGQNRQYLARLNPVNGAADSFNPAPSDYVVSIYIDSNGKVLVGGGSGMNHVARFDPITGNQEDFYPVPNGDVEAIAEYPDGRILLAGIFTQLSPGGGTPEIRNHIALVNPDGTLDSTFNADIVNVSLPSFTLIHAMKRQPDGKILVGGVFTQVNSQSRNFIARLNSDGTLDNVFNPNANGQINSITIQSDGKILITGGFDQVGGLPRNRVARLNEVTGAPEFIGGTIDEYNPNVNGVVYASAIQADGKVLIGGDFSSVGGVSRSKFARLTNDTYAISDIIITRNSVTLRLAGSSPQTNLARFELSTDGGATFTFLGNGTQSLSPSNNPKIGSLSPTSPQSSNYTLNGLNLPTGQDILIRATNSESTNEKVQSAFLLAPTAASVSISGRVRTPIGRGLSNATVSLTDTSGTTRMARTNSFGYFRFNEIEAGQTVIVSVRSKRYQFEPRVLTVSEDLNDLDFVPMDSKFERK